MNVAFDLRYASDHFPGIGTYAVALLDRLLAHGAADRFDVLWDPSAGAERFDLGDIANHQRVRWHELSAPALGLTGIPMVGGWLRRLRPDVYFSPYFIAPWRAGCPVVLTLHDTMVLDRPQDYRWTQRTVFSLLVRMAPASAHWMTVSQFSREQVRRHTRIADSHLHVAYPGVLPQLLSGSAERPNGAPDPPFALAVGINKPHKNLATLVEAWSRFGTPPLPLVSAGPIDARFPSAAALARDRAPGVHSLGVVSESGLRWLYRHATLFVFPSFYEGFGSPLVEAMASGLPVIASDLPVLRELGGDAPLWVPPDDPDRWMRAIRQLCSDPGERQVRASAARDRAARFSYQSTADTVREVLAQAAAEAR